MEKVLVITGQTASGKTNISLKIAKLLNGEIINGDAMQVYKGLDIITDKINKDKINDVPHHLFDIKNIDENYNVMEHQHNIRQKIEEITKRGKLPIIVGGTGLYIKAALYDYEFINEDIDNEKEAALYDKYTNDELYQMLLNIDPESCNNIHKNNRKRIIRALSIAKNTNKTKSEIINEQEHKLVYDAIVISITMDKDKSIAKMDERIEQMFLNGAIEEVKNNKTTSTASKAIGYKEISDYLDNKISLEEAKNLMKIHTHQYAKRQRTWMKNQMNAYFVENDENVINNIIDIVNNKWNLKA